MILYGTSFSPFARKVLVFAREKGIDLALVSTADDPDGFRTASPFRKIPALKHGDFLLSDSSAIVAYLEKLHPDPNLIPDEAQAHGRALWFEEYADAIVQVCVQTIFLHRVAAPMFYGKPGKPEIADAVEAKEFQRAVEYLESVIPPSGFLVEDRLTLADIAVASAYANLDHARCRPDPVKQPKAAAYLAAIWARPAFAELLAAERAAIAQKR